MTSKQSEPTPNGAEDAAFAEALRAALTLAATAETVAAPDSPDQLLDRLVRAAAEAIPSPEGALMLIDTETRVLTFDIVIGQTATKVKQFTLPLGRGIAGLVAVSGQPLAVANAQQDPRHARDIAEQVGYLPNTILAVPVTDAQGGVIGVLELLDRQGAPTYSLDDMELLGRFAELCSLALAQRRAHALHTALIGRSLAALGGLSPEAQRHLADRIELFAARAAADPVARRAQVLAERIAAIAVRGEAEQRACEGVLEVFAEYVAAHPEPGTGLDAYGLGFGFPRGQR
jgi:GAF domain-containing protein